MAARRRSEPGGQGMKRLMASGVLMVVLAAGCATAPPRPSVYASPTKRQPPDRIGPDMAQCESWAHQQTGFDPAAETAKGAVVGAVVGGALGAGGGAALGAASGGSAGRGAATGAVLGGVVGGVAGGAIQYSRSKEGFDRAYASCMNARGYYTGPAVAMTPPPPPPAPVVVAPPPPQVVVVHQPPPVVVHQPPPASSINRHPSSSTNRRPSSWWNPDAFTSRRVTIRHPATAASGIPAGLPASSRIHFPATSPSRFPRARSSSTRASPGTVTMTGTRTRGVSRGRCPR